MAEFKFTVTPEEDGTEIRALMRRHFDFSSRMRGRIRREGAVLRNGTPVEVWLPAKAGDLISVDMPKERSYFTPEDIPVYPVYEDEDLLVINKQPHLTVHPTKGHPCGTAANALTNYMEKTGETFKIRFVNRLDMDTSGLLIVAKNAYAQNDLVQQMNSGHLIKEYVALVLGVIGESSGVIDLPIGHSDPSSPCRNVCEDGAPSVTRYTVLERFSDGFTLLRLRLETGRTHQIRVHMSHIGHPVAGDQLYGGVCPLIGRQALHAASLRFTHPHNKKELLLEAPLPDDMRGAIDSLR